ncbi:MAG: diaminopimelate epimerase [Deltaproteobacteria bacterium]|jgi:diaminopimelate epimerase|nr:diaminopimelate epimerase [Deltaproteobacteria bacterium]
MKFTKMHGAGNDYIYINGFDTKVSDPAKLAKEISDRHFGVGSDGMILILPSKVADVRMRMFNADGTEAEMCGNGLRCVGKYVYDHSLIRKQQITVETGAGILALDMSMNAKGHVNRVRVNMGRPKLSRGEVPMTGPSQERFVDQELSVLDRTFQATCVSMGNPHCVIYIENIENFPVHLYGPAIENLPDFPQRTNVEFVEVLDLREVRQRTWERGAGETLACGTGAAAVTVAGVLTGRTSRTLLNHLLGGDLEMEWDGENDVFMTGPAVEVFSGEYGPR